MLYMYCDDDMSKIERFTCFCISLYFAYFYTISYHIHITLIIHILYVIQWRPVIPPTTLPSFRTTASVQISQRRALMYVYICSVVQCSVVQCIMLLSYVNVMLCMCVYLLLRYGVYCCIIMLYRYIVYLYPYNPYPLLPCILYPLSIGDLCLCPGDVWQRRLVRHYVRYQYGLSACYRHDCTGVYKYNMQCMYNVYSDYMCIYCYCSECIIYSVSYCIERRYICILVLI